MSWEKNVWRVESHEFSQSSCTWCESCILGIKSSSFKLGVRCAVYDVHGWDIKMPERSEGCPVYWHYSGISVVCRWYCPFGLYGRYSRTIQCFQMWDWFFTEIGATSFAQRSLSGDERGLYKGLSGSLVPGIPLNNKHITDLNVNWGVDKVGIVWLCLHTAVQLHSSSKHMPLWTSLLYLFGSLDVYNTPYGEHEWSDGVVGEHVWDNRRNSSWIYCMSDLLLIKTRVKAVGLLLQSICCWFCCG